MKIEGKKDLTKMRQHARDEIDLVFIPRINAILGPKFPLYQAKQQLVASAVIQGAEAEDILDRFDTLMQRILPLEDERQAMQARIDNAASALEIETIVKGIKNG